MKTMIYESEKILVVLQQNRKFTEELSYEQNDIRVDFFRYINSILDRYFKGFCYIEVLNEIYEKRAINPDKLVTKEQFFHILENNVDNMKRIAYFSDLTRSLLIDSWSVFEMSITTILETILTHEELNKILRKDYDKINTILSKSGLGNKDITTIDKLLVDNQINKEHLTHLSVNRKFEKLFKIINIEYNNRRNIIRDKEFLKFFGKYRNGMHLNFIYFGKDYEFNFRNQTFVFTNAKPIKTPIKPIELDLIVELVNIFKAIISCLDNNLVIKSYDEFELTDN